MLWMLDGPAAGQVATKAMAWQIEILQSHLVSPFFKIIQEIIDAFFSCNFITVIIQRPWTSAHSGQVYQDETKMFCHLLQNFEEEWAWPTPSVYEYQNWFVMISIHVGFHGIAAIFPRIVITANDRVYVYDLVFELSDGDVHNSKLLLWQSWKQ